MGKHTRKNGVAQNRSRARRTPEEIAETTGRKGFRRIHQRLRPRIQFFNDVESKCTRNNHDHHRPGSMKARTN